MTRYEPQLNLVPASGRRSMAMALGLLGVFFGAGWPGACAIPQDTPRPPVVTRTRDTWKVVGGGHSRTYRTSDNYTTPAVVDKRRQLIVLPTNGFIVGIDFQGKELWKYALPTGLDPWPLFQVDGVLIAGIGRLFENRSLRVRKGYGAYEVASKKQTPWMVGLDPRTGKALWTLDEFSGGSPLIGLDENSLLCLRVSNPLRYYGALERARYELDLRDPATGRLLRAWHVRHAPAEMYIAMGLPPWSPLQEYTRVSRSPAGWKIAIGLLTMAYSAKPVPAHSYLYIVVPLKGTRARCRVVHQKL